MLHLYLLNFTVLKWSVNAKKGEQSYSLVNLVSYNNHPSAQTCHWCNSGRNAVRVINHFWIGYNACSTR